MCNSSHSSYSKCIQCSILINEIEEVLCFVCRLPRLQLRSYFRYRKRQVCIDLLTGSNCLDTFNLIFAETILGLHINKYCMYYHLLRCLINSTTACTLTALVPDLDEGGGRC